MPRGNRKRGNPCRGARATEGIGYDLHGKITKCALAGSFDDNEAVKQTRYFEMGSTLSWCWILSECRREETGERGKARGLWSSFLDGSKFFVSEVLLHWHPWLSFPDARIQLGSSGFWAELVSGYFCTSVPVALIAMKKNRGWMGGFGTTPNKHANCSGWQSWV